MKILGYPGRPKLIIGVPVERPGAGVREKDGSGDQNDVP